MKAWITSLLLFFGFHSHSQTALFVPDTLSGTNFVLNMHKDSVNFFTGKPSYTYAYNAFKYLGPTLIFNKGDSINIVVNNQIGDTTTVHWHGIHLASKWDGGPHSPIFPGASWNPKFKVMDHAATYWYHPHLHQKTALQAIKGAAGLIIVRDSIESTLNLPRRYGLDDFPLIIQSQQYDSLNQAMPLGMEDSTILINGARANYGYSVYAQLPAQIVRLRLLNASGERVFNFGLSTNAPFKIIASDGGLLNTPVSVNRIRLAPGERVEILLDLNGMDGQVLYLMSYASELAMGIQGGPTMPMPVGSPPMNSPLNGIDFNILQINVVPQTPSPIITIPTILTSNTTYTSSSTNRTIRFTADSAMVMDGPFYFNDSTFDMMHINYRIPINSVEKWKLVNETMVAHPFHIHDVQFFLIDRSGAIPNPEERGRKDVVLVAPYDSVTFITKFEDFADTSIPYMYHCHILMHEDAGMMGQFVVLPATTSVQETMQAANQCNIYPNPCSQFISLNLPLPFDIKIVNELGNLVFEQNNINIPKLDLRSLSDGTYFIFVRSNKHFYWTKMQKLNH